MREVEPGAVIDADLAIVGTGPAGLSLANEFLGSSIRVVLLESGGLQEDGEVATRELFESVGAPRVMEPRLLRNRVLGGTSHTWSGRCRTFDDIDYEHRPWVPHSGWPITAAEMYDYERRAAELMNIGPNIYGRKLWDLLAHDRPDPDVSPEMLEPCFWQFSRDPDRPLDFLRFGPRFIRQKADNFRVFCNATVTQVETDAGGRRLSALEVTPVPGNTVRVVPKVAVLAAGGIENARLLLASNRISPEGVGNAKGLVGRFLMDHPRTSIGHYAAGAAHAIQQRLGLFGLKHLGRTFFYSHGYAMNPALQRREELLNCAAYLSEHRADDDPWDALKRLFGRQSERHLKDVLAAVSNPRLLLEGFYRRAFQGRNVSHKIDRLVVDCIVEQVPDPDSRITLSERSDEHGVPLPRLHWKISELERRTVAELARTFYGEMHRIGLPEPEKPEWLRDGSLDAIPFADAAHPTGTTRMSDDASKGVVDADCKVHGVEGLFVAGSSVFPTASHANPTLMVAALSVRLADTLKKLHLGLIGSPYIAWSVEAAVML